MMTMMESTTTIDLTDTAAPQATSIEEIHIETIEERFSILYIDISLFCFLFHVLLIRNAFKMSLSTDVCIELYLLDNELYLLYNNENKSKLLILMHQYLCY